MEKRFLPAPRRKIEEYQPEVRRVLRAIGVERAFVTDLSKVHDFAAFWAPDAVGTDAEVEIVAENCRILKEKLGIPVRPNSRIWSLAKRLRNKKDKS